MPEVQPCISLRAARFSLPQRSSRAGGNERRGETSARTQRSGGRAELTAACAVLSSEGRRAPRSLHAHRAPLSPNPISAQLIASVSGSGWVCCGTKHGFPLLLLQRFAGEHSHKMLPLWRESTALHKHPAFQTLALEAPNSVGPRQ